MRIFKNAWFDRFARKHGISDATLVAVARSIESGRIQADLGGGVLKHRLARPGQGKSGGYRVIILYRKGQRVFFVYAFGKNQRGNITGHEDAQFKKAAKYVLNLSEQQLMALIKQHQFTEIDSDGQKIPQ